MQTRRKLTDFQALHQYTQSQFVGNKTENAKNKILQYTKNEAFH